MKKMIVFGTGEAICLHYTNTAFALYNGEEYFLTDGTGGPDIIRCFKAANIDWSKLHYAFLSHEHTDHLLGMVWALRNVAEYMTYGGYDDGRFTIFTHDVAAEKLKTICKMLLKPLLYDKVENRMDFVLVEDGQQVEVMGDTFTFFDIQSKKAKQFGYRLDSKDGHSIVFLGDEPFNEHCAKYMENCQWLLTEAFCLQAEEHIYNPKQLFHSTVRDSSLTAERFHVENLVLWHTEDRSTYGRRKELYTAEAREYYSGNVFVPDDMETIDLW